MPITTCTSKSRLNDLTDTNRFFRDDPELLQPFYQALQDAIADHQREHGRSVEWDAVIEHVTPFPRNVDGNSDTLAFGEQGRDYSGVLTELMPWRKGPFQFGDTFVDTEWRSDWKWQRIFPHLSDLKGRSVLDIGCGNGYHLFRMLGAGASLALGIDPTILFNYQFALLQRLSAENAAYLLPLRGEHLPAFNCFDTVFSLGVLYHRRSPLDHLQELKGFLRPGGELVLETLVVDGNQSTVLMPEDRYAKMANVWFIPSTLMLETMLRRVGFKKIRTVDVTMTTTQEQRSTPWMNFQSLPDFLDVQDQTKTIEGYQSPTRAIVIAEKPQ